MFLYRPAYYKNQGISLDTNAKGKEQIQPTPQANQQQIPDDKRADLVEVIVAKNRSGRVGKTELFFMPAFGRFFTPEKENNFPSMPNMPGANYSDKFKDADNDD